MKYRAIPHTDLIVSEVGVAVGNVVAPPSAVRDALTAVRLLRQAYDQGVNYFDLSYRCEHSDGAVRLAEAFSSSLRDKVVIAAGFSSDGNESEAWTLDEAKRGLELALTRLGTDWIDVYQLRNPPKELLENGTLVEWLDRLRRSGRIRAAGLMLSCEETWSTELRTEIDRLKILLVQADGRLFSQIDNRPLPSSLERDSDHRKFGVTARLSNCQDFFTGGSGSLENFQFLWEGAERSANQAAVQFLLSRPGVCTVLPEFTSEADLADFTGAPMAAAFSEPELAAAESLWEQTLKERFRRTHRFETAATTVH